MSEKRQLYVNPLGHVDDTNLQYNNVDKLKRSGITVDARILDTNLAIDAHYLQLTIWSVTAGISIIALLLLIREANKNR